MCWSWWGWGWVGVIDAGCPYRREDKKKLTNVTGHRHHLPSPLRLHHLQLGSRRRAAQFKGQICVFNPSTPHSHRKSPDRPKLPPSFTDPHPPRAQGAKYCIVANVTAEETAASKIPMNFGRWQSQHSGRAP